MENYVALVVLDRKKKKSGNSQKKRMHTAYVSVWRDGQ